MGQAIAYFGVKYKYCFYEILFLYFKSLDLKIAAVIELGKVVIAWC